MDGSQTQYSQLFRAAAGDIIVNKIWARSGSVAVVTEPLAGRDGSGEFPMAGKIKEAQGLRQQAVEIGEGLVGAKARPSVRSALKAGNRVLHSVATLERGKFSHRPRNEPRFFGL